MSSRTNQILRAFVETFPPLRLALRGYDCIIFTLRSIFNAIYRFVRFLINSIIQYLFWPIYSYIISLFKSNNRTSYKPLIKSKKDSLALEQHTKPLPYKNQLIKKSLTYQGGIILGVLLYLFVYYVLIKHHNYTTVLVATLLLLAYLIVLENSHTIRSIIMLCLPIMITNRGRALIFCLMISIMLAGPLKNTQLNINELHLSLNCCKQFLILKSDRYLDENVVSKAVKVEEVVLKLVDNIKEFTQEIRARFKILIQLALTVQRYIIACIDKLKEIVNVCNTHTLDAYNNCLRTFENAYTDCEDKLGPTFDVLCGIVKPLTNLCSLVHLPKKALCEIPREIVTLIDNTIGQRLRNYIDLIENELYVDVDVERVYFYNGTKSKSYKTVAREINFDIKQKFWYIHVFSGIFKLVSLILVCWILLTATLYHMHYLTEIDYDNGYIDDYLRDIDERRKLKFTSENEERKKSENLIDLESKSSLDDDDDDDDDEMTNEERQRVKSRTSSLFPMPSNQERRYFKTFSLFMNETERHKLYIAGFIWLLICGYIFFFVFLDYSLFKLIELMQNILNDILFNSDLPIIDVSSKSDGDRVIHYNRTYINYLRTKKLKGYVENSTTNRRISSLYKTNSSIESIYRRLMDSIEENVPDDVSILDSIHDCLPRTSEPNYQEYKNLSLLALITFIAVIVEAYALRARHCIANLYYPRQARERSIWFYQKLLKEKPVFENQEKLINEEDKREGKRGDKFLKLGLKVLEGRQRKKV